MTRAAMIRKSDLKRYAEVANESGCKIVIQKGDAVITVEPEATKSPLSNIDYSRPVL